MSHVCTLVWCTWCTRANWYACLMPTPSAPEEPPLPPMPPPLSPLVRVPTAVERTQVTAAAVASGANNNLRLRPGSFTGIRDLPAACATVLLAMSGGVCQCCSVRLTSDGPRMVLPMLLYEAVRSIRSFSRMRCPEPEGGVPHSNTLCISQATSEYHPQ